MPSGLQKMMITAYSDQNYKVMVGEPFMVWINPSTYTHRYKILYNTTGAQGSGGSTPKFNRMGPDVVSFDLMFDATGVVPSPIAGKSNAPSDGVAGMIAEFQALVFNMNGNIHSPNFVMLSWAQLQFQGRLETLTIVYTLFRPDGTPLRAKASVGFLGFTSNSQQAKKDNKRSPDLTHAVTVTAGDTLPGLCHRIYGTSLPYLKVAEANRISNVRSLVPGTMILFPPLTGAPS